MVIGGTGYIGTPLVTSLSTLGYKVTVLSRKKIESTEEIRYILGDILDKKDLFEGVNDFDLIIYLAAVIRTIFKYKKGEFNLNNALMEIIKK